MTGHSSLLVSGLNCVDVLCTSAKYLYDIETRGVTIEDCNGRLAAMFHRYVSAAQIQINVQGEVDHNQTYIVMSNHQSHYDIPVFFEAFGPNLRMVAKKEISRVPFWGPALREAGFVFVDRSNLSDAKVSIQEATGVLASGFSMWIAPEGTRSKDGTLGPFKMGGFHMALNTGLPILPVTIDGTRKVLPVGSFRTKLGQTVRVTFHDPISPKVFGPNTKEARQSLATKVRQVIQGGFEL